MNTITLKFDNTMTRLAGNPYGKKIYDEQVKDNYTDYTKKLDIIFPNNIEKIASSFVQGFFSYLVSEIGYEGIDENITIKAGSEELSKLIIKRLY